MYSCEFSAVPEPANASLTSYSRLDGLPLEYLGSSNRSFPRVGRPNRLGARSPSMPAWNAWQRGHCPLPIAPCSLFFPTPPKIIFSPSSSSCCEDIESHVFFSSTGGNPPSTCGSQFPYPERNAATKNINPPTFNIALRLVKYKAMTKVVTVIVTRDTGNKRLSP